LYAIRNVIPVSFANCVPVQFSFCTPVKQCGAACQARAVRRRQPVDDVPGSGQSHNIASFLLEVL
jgi:hypothetical protein